MKIADLKPTPVFDAYWYFAAERQRVFFERLKRTAPPWTNDPIISKYRFTNAYRASDRVSQYLIKNVIYDGADRTPEDICFRIILFKLFNKIETWEYLESNVGEICIENFDCDRYGSLLESRLSAKTAIYSSAYIMPSGKTSFGNKRKHRNHLALVDYINKSNIAKSVARASCLEDVYSTLLQYPTIGGFLAYQLSIDLNYSELCDFSEMSFVVAGPGACSGIAKCFERYREVDFSGIIELVTAEQENEFNKRGIVFPKLFGRSLQLIDCQNIFCETDKYARIAYPDHKGFGERTRIKRTYRDEGLSYVVPFYPPKWGLNEVLSAYMTDHVMI